MRPPFVGTEKQVLVTFDMSKVNQYFFFPFDEELDNAIILGIKLNSFPNLVIKNQNGVSQQISISLASNAVITMVDDTDKKIMDTYPLVALAGLYQNANFGACTIRFQDNTKIKWSKCFLQVIGGPVIIFNGVAPFTVLYVPKGMKRK